jgi:hypothetical protein
MPISPDTSELVSAERGFYYTPNAIVDIVTQHGVMDFSHLRRLAFLVASHDEEQVFSQSGLKGNMRDLASLDEANPVVDELLSGLEIEDPESWSFDLSDKEPFERRVQFEDFIEDTTQQMLNAHNNLMEVTNG